MSFGQFGYRESQNHNLEIQVHFLKATRPKNRKWGQNLVILHSFTDRSENLQIYVF